MSSSSSVQTKSPAVVDHGVFDSAYCPICIEAYDELEWRFFPCPCNYRLCSMCLHQIRIDDGKCPQCREAYQEIRFRVLSASEVGPLLVSASQRNDPPPVKVVKAKRNFGREAKSRHTIQQAKPVSNLPQPPQPPPPRQEAAPARMSRFTGGIGVWD